MEESKIIEIRKATRSTDATKPFADSIAFANALLESREFAGWMIMDKNGVHVRFMPVKDYAPCSTTEIIDRQPDVLMLEYMDREYSYYSPHTLKKFYL